MIRDPKHLASVLLRTQMGLEALSGLCEVSFAHDVVTIKHAAGFVSRERHSDPIGDSRSHHIADGSSAEIVNGPGVELHDLVQFNLAFRPTVEPPGLAAPEYKLALTLRLVSSIELSRSLDRAAR